MNGQEAEGVGAIRTYIHLLKYKSHEGRGFVLFFSLLYPQCLELFLLHSGY